MARGLRSARRMPRTVDDIMNKELLALRHDLPAREALELLQSFGVGAAPILDENRKPVGVVSVRNRLETDRSVHDVMTRPVACVSMSSTIEAAAEQMARGDRHHLVVVDGTGAAVGMLSTLESSARPARPSRAPPSSVSPLGFVDAHFVDGRPTARRRELATCAGYVRRPASRDEPARGARRDCLGGGMYERALTGARLRVAPDASRAGAGARPRVGRPASLPRLPRRGPGDARRDHQPLAVESGPFPTPGARRMRTEPRFARWPFAPRRRRRRNHSLAPALGKSSV